MFLSIYEARNAADRIAAALTIPLDTGETTPKGIPLDIAKYLGAVAVGYADWLDLERRVSTPRTLPAPSPETILANLADDAVALKVWDHPIAIEALLYSDAHIADRPAEWIDETLRLSHLAHEDITRLEAAEAVFDYIRLKSDPEIADMELTIKLALSLRMEIDREHLQLIEHATSNTAERLAIKDTLDLLVPSGWDGRARLALAARASRIAKHVESMDIRQLTEILVPSLKHIAKAGGGVSAGHILLRLIGLRPPRGNWRDPFEDQLPPRN